MTQAEQRHTRCSVCWFMAKRKPRDPGPDRDERERLKKPDPDDRTRAHHRHGGGLLEDLDGDETA